MEQQDLELIGLRERVMLIDAELAARGKDPSGFGIPVWQWHIKKAQLIQEKSRLVAQLQSVRDARSQKRVAESAVSKEYFLRVLSVLSACRSIIAGIDDLGPEDKDVLERATEVLRKAHVIK